MKLKITQKVKGESKKVNVERVTVTLKNGTQFELSETGTGQLYLRTMAQALSLTPIVANAVAVNTKPFGEQ